MNKIKETWRKLLSSNSSPHEIALGLSIGVFVGFTPLVGIQTILILLLIFIIPKINKISAYLSSWVMNQFTFVPIYLLNYWIGAFILKIENKLEYSEFTKIILQRNLSQIINIGKNIFIPMLLGGLIVASTLALLTYIISRFLIEIRNIKANF